MSSKSTQLVTTGVITGASYLSSFALRGVGSWIGRKVSDCTNCCQEGSGWTSKATSYLGGLASRVSGCVANVLTCNKDNQIPTSTLHVRRIFTGPLFEEIIFRGPIEGLRWALGSVSPEVQFAIEGVAGLITSYAFSSAHEPLMSFEKALALHKNGSPKEKIEAEKAIAQYKHSMGKMAKLLYNKGLITNSVYNSLINEINLGNMDNMTPIVKQVQKNQGFSRLMGGVEYATALILCHCYAIPYAAVVPIALHILHNLTITASQSSTKVEKVVNWLSLGAFSGFNQEIADKLTTHFSEYDSEGCSEERSVLGK